MVFSGAILRRFEVQILGPVAIAGSAKAARIHGGFTRAECDITVIIRRLPRLSILALAGYSQATAKKCTACLAASNERGPYRLQALHDL